MGGDKEMVMGRDNKAKGDIVAFEKQITSSIETNRSNSNVTVKINYCAIRFSPPYDKEIILSLMECLNKNKTPFILAEVIPHPGFSYYYEMENLKSIEKIKRALSIRTVHPFKNFSINEPIYQFLLSIEDKTELLYLLKAFDHGAQLAVFVVDTFQSFSEIAKLLKKKFELSYFSKDPLVNEILSEIFTRSEYVLHFGFDGDLLCVETMRDGLIEKIKECLESKYEKKG